MKTRMRTNTAYVVINIEGLTTVVALSEVDFERLVDAIDVTAFDDPAPRYARLGPDRLELRGTIRESQVISRKRHVRKARAFLRNLSLGVVK